MDLFYRASKALAWVGDPSAWAILLVALAVAASSARRPAIAAMLCGVAALQLLAFSSPSLVAALHDSLTTSSAVPMYRPHVRYDAVVVLGGGDDRVEGAAEVVRSGGGRYLLYSGALSPRGVADVVRELEASGVPRARIVFEHRSRNTYENAVQSARMATEHGWRSILVVTSASHVRRALGCFHRVGLHPDVLPVEDGEGLKRGGWIPTAAALAESRCVLHEIIGRVVYRLVGYSA